ncbi:MAG: hypothetical protein Q8N51_18415, partial [Gammaproteobacteria bacterium]|nr:hypothetical protein [Gammaproteobacteria bacterium]
KGANNQVDHRQGNLDVEEGEEVIWEANGANEAAKAFSVLFYRLDNGKPIWPFTTLKDGGTVPPAGYIGPLDLASGESTPALKTLAGAGKVKYEVAAEERTGDPKIDKCDPMIIIRPPVFSKALFGSICVLLGAFGGAALTWWKLTS